MNKHNFESYIYLSIKDISLGINIFSDKRLVYGKKGRVTGIEVNLLFFHFKIGIVRSGF